MIFLYLDLGPKLERLRWVQFYKEFLIQPGFLCGRHWLEKVTCIIIEKKLYLDQLENNCI